MSNFVVYYTFIISCDSAGSGPIWDNCKDCWHQYWAACNRQPPHSYNSHLSSTQSQVSVGLYFNNLFIQLLHVEGERCYRRNK